MAQEVDGGQPAGDSFAVVLLWDAGRCLSSASMSAASSHKPPPPDRSHLLQADYTLWPFWCEMFTPSDTPWLYPDVLP